MQPNKTKIAIVVGAMYLGVSGASMAASESFSITAATIADVSIVEDQALEFGANIFPAAGGACSMDASDPGDALLQFNLDATPTAGAGGFGLLSGTGCVAVVATPGIYTVTGAPGTSVNISFGSITTAEFTFTPGNGVYSNYDGANDGDSETALSVTTTTDDLANAADATAVTGDDNVTAGELVFTLGGDLAVLTELTSGTLYDAETFIVSVTY